MKIINWQNIIRFTVIFITISCTQCNTTPNLNHQVNQLKKDIQQNPENVNLHYELGMVYHSQKKYSKSKKELKQAIMLNPNHAKAHNLLGHIYNEEDDYELAIEHYQKAIQSDENFMEPYNSLEVLYSQMNSETYKKEIAVKQRELLETAVVKCDRVNSKNFCILNLNNLSVLFLDNKSRYNEKDFEHVIKYSKMGLELLEDEEDLRKYVKYLDKNEINLDRGLFYYYIGEAYKELNNNEKAQDSYKKALSEFKSINDEYWIKRVENAIALEGS